MNITIIEANMTGMQHSYPNGIYVRMLSELLKNDNIDLYCSKEHFDNMGIEKNNTNIIFHPIKVVPGNEHMIKKFFIEYPTTMRILNKTKNKIIIFLSQCPDIQLPVIYKARKWKNKRIIIFTHGELEGLLNKQKWKVWSYPFWISKCFKIDMPDNVFRIVLGKSIKKYLDDNYGCKNIFYINQPRDGFVDTNDSVPKYKNNLYGYIGDCSESKGGVTYAKASNYIKENSKSKFMIIGRCLVTIESEEYPNIVRMSDKNDFLPLDEYQQNIEKLTYVCLTYPSDSYKLTASGAVLDAVRLLKPIIYIKNAYFDSIFSGFGDVGYRCENYEEFKETIRMVDENPNENRYQRQVENLRKVQKQFLITTIEKELKNILEIVNNK